MTCTQPDAGRRYNGDKNKSASRKSPTLQSPTQSPQTEKSLELQLTRKMSKLSGKELRGLWDTWKHSAPHLYHNYSHRRVRGPRSQSQEQ